MKRREEEEPQERGEGGQQGGRELDRWNNSDNYAVFGLASVVTLLLMALSSTPLHASDTHVRNWLSIFVAFDESVIVRCGRPSERKGGSGAYYAVRDVEAGEELPTASSRVPISRPGSMLKTTTTRMTKRI